MVHRRGRATRLRRARRRRRTDRGHGRHRPRRLRRAQGGGIRYARIAYAHGGGVRLERSGRRGRWSPRPQKSVLVLGNGIDAGHAGPGRENLHGFRLGSRAAARRDGRRIVGHRDGRMPADGELGDIVGRGRGLSRTAARRDHGAVVGRGLTPARRDHRPVIGLGVSRTPA
ncbi:hypothetical protein OB08_11860 [Microbacterium sp. HJ5]